jgi:hypothetical protein
LCPPLAPQPSLPAPTPPPPTTSLHPHPSQPHPPTPPSLSNHPRVSRCPNNNDPRLVADISPVRALHLIQTVIKPKITYCLAIAPLSRAQLDRLDRLLCRIAKQCLLLPKSFPVRGTLMPRDQGGIGVTSLLVDTAQACAQLLTRQLNDTNNTNTDPSSLAIIAATSMRRQLDGLGHLPGTHTWPVRQSIKMP